MDIRLDRSKSERTWIVTKLVNKDLDPQVEAGDDNGISRENSRELSQDSSSQSFIPELRSSSYQKSVSLYEFDIWMEKEEPKISNEFP